VRLKNPPESRHRLHRPKRRKGPRTIMFNPSCFCTKTTRQEAASFHRHWAREACRTRGARRQRNADSRRPRKAMVMDPYNQDRNGLPGLHNKQGSFTSEDSKSAIHS
jgi:hypothetical protein